MNLRKALWLSNMLIFCLIVWQGTEIALSWTSKRDASPPHSRRRPPVFSPDSALKNQAKDFSEFRAVIEHNIFKTADAGDAAPQKQESLEPVEEIEVTKLDLTLKGTVLGVNEPSFAVIEEGKGKEEELYYLSDFVQGARIVRILPDRVILDVNGKEEALIMTAERAPMPRSRLPYARSLPQRRIVQRRPPVRINPLVNQPAEQEPEDVDEEEPLEKGVEENDG